MFTWGRLSRFLGRWLAMTGISRGLFHLWHRAVLQLLKLGIGRAGLRQPLDAELLSCCQEVLEVLLVHIDLSMIHEVEDSHHVREPDPENKIHEE